jgi:hypothetical protein
MVANSIPEPGAKVPGARCDRGYSPSRAVKALNRRSVRRLSKTVRRSGPLTSPALYMAGPVDLGTTFNDSGGLLGNDR